MEFAALDCYGRHAAVANTARLRCLAFASTEHHMAARLHTASTVVAARFTAVVLKLGEWHSIGLQLPLQLRVSDITGNSTCQQQDIAYL